jgi:hypothetical protein
MTTKKTKIKQIDDDFIDPNFIIDLDELTPVETLPNPNITESSKIQPTKKISETIYKRPLITYTDKLSKQQVKELLVDYEQIKSLDELQNITSGTHLRYFEKKNNELKFRTGGILTVSGFPEYLILSSGHVSWSVQIKKCIFFKRITIKQVKAEYDKLLHENAATIIGLQTTIRNLSKEIKKLIKENEKLKNN